MLGFFSILAQKAADPFAGGDLPNIAVNPGQLIIDPGELHLTGRAVPPFVKLAIQDDPGADIEAGPEEDQAVGLFAHAEVFFSKRGEVDIVHDDDFIFEIRPENICQVDNFAAVHTAEVDMVFIIAGGRRR